MQNNSEAVISQNIAVTFNELPDSIELQNPSGTDATGNPYINLRNAIPKGGLDKGQTSDPVEVIFDNPDLAEFPLVATVLAGGENIAPEFEAIGDLTVTPGERLEIPLVATDGDGDRIELAIESDKPLPQGKLTGDGTLIFSPTPEEIGSYQLTLIAFDGSAETTQTVTLTVPGDTTTTYSLPW